MGNQTFYGDRFTSEALQYQFSIIFKQVQEHWRKKKHGIELPPPLGVYLHINFKTQTHQSSYMIQTKLSTLSISYSNENINQVKTQLATMSQNESWMMCESLAHADDRRELEGGG